MESEKTKKTDVEAILAREKKSSPRKRMLFWLLAIVLILMLAWGAFSWFAKDDASLQFQTEEIRRGEITVTVTATGTLEPVNMVDVGTEVSGTVESIEADFNDRVQAGQILARLDTSKLEAQLLQSKAGLETARAKVVDAEASVFEAEKEHGRMKKAWELSGGKLPSEKEIDNAETALKRALASAAAAKAQVAEAEARLSLDEANYAKALIRSPINGIVLTRNVEIGQTVAASLQTPVLFRLAEDLAWMELHADVDEADIGKVSVGQKAMFTVDAYPDRTFEAEVTEVRFSPQTVEGVVTYEALLSVDNSLLLLRPGMTATANITIETVRDVLLAPNAALRFAPPRERSKERSSSLLGMLFKRPSRSSPRDAADSRTRKKILWTLREVDPVPVPVQTGETDGLMTEVSGEQVIEGLSVVVAVIEKRE